jgi:hypothetical protein
MRCFFGDGAPVKCGRRPIQEIFSGSSNEKARSRFPARAFAVLAMMRI